MLPHRFLHIVGGAEERFVHVRADGVYRRSDRACRLDLAPQREMLSRTTHVEDSGDTVRDEELEQRALQLDGAGEVHVRRSQIRRYVVDADADGPRG